MSDVVNEIQVFLKTQCALRNLAHADPQLVIDRYARDFASRYESILLAHCAKFKDLSRKYIEKQFAEDGVDVPVMGKPVLRGLKTIAMSILDELSTKVIEFVSEIARWNRPPLTFTPNEHYLDSIFRGLVKNDTTTGSTDEGSATLQYYHVRAYLKVEKKAVLEQHPRFLCRILKADLQRR